MATSSKAYNKHGQSVIWDVASQLKSSFRCRERYIYKEVMEFIDKSFALILWATDENGEDDVAVFAGKLIQRDAKFYLKRKDGSFPQIRDEWLPRIKLVQSDQKEILKNCDYQLSLSVGNLDKDIDNINMFGLKWPT